VTPVELIEAIRNALISSIEDGALALSVSDLPEQVHVERPRQREHGDWATNIALQLAKKGGTNPRALAQELANRLGSTAGVAKVEVAGPGFLNITLDAAAAGELAKTIVEAGQDYGRSETGAGKKINLEFVSANPTGPIHIGGTRWAAVGDSLARVMEATGAQVCREYYFNDHGAQIDRFARSLVARALGQDAPEDGYGGQYIQDIADAVLAGAKEVGDPDPLTLDEADRQEYFRA
jgi:arginyl-tRNA synthetase